MHWYYTFLFYVNAEKERGGCLTSIKNSGILELTQVDEAHPNNPLINTTMNHFFKPPFCYNLE